MTNIERIQENVRRLQAQGQGGDTITEYLKSEGYTPTRYEQAVTRISKLAGPPVEAGFGRSVLQGLSFNFADEAEAALRAGSVSGPRYEQELARVREGIKQYEEAYPGRAFVGEAVGSLAPTVAGLVAAPFTGGTSAAITGARTAQQAAKIPGLLSQVKRGTVAGGTTGAISGVGGAEGGAESRVLGGVIGGLTGGTLGAATPVATNVLGVGARKVGETVGVVKPQDATQKAQEILARKIAQEGMTPEQLAARQAETVRTLGARDETLADIGGEGVRRLARGAMAIPQAAETDARQMLTERAVAAGPRIIKDITDLTAVGARDLDEVASDIITRRATLATPFYDQARAAGQVESFAIDNLLKKSKDIQQAISNARRLPQYADLPDNDMNMLDKAYKYVGDLADMAKQSGEKERFRDLDALRTQLRAAITDKVPVYGKALDTFSGESALLDALNSGREKFLRKSPAQIQREIASLKDEGQQQMYRLGAIQTLRDEIYGEKNQFTDVASKFLNDRNMKDRFKQVFNSTGEYESFIKNLQREQSMARTRGMIEGGSPTARIGQEIAEIQGPAPSEIISAGAQMARGDVLGGGANLLRQLVPRMQGLDENVAEQITRSVLDPSFARQQETLIGLTPVLDELRRRALQQQVRATGYSATAGTAVPGLLGD
jgi:hypothetical protein